MGFIDAISDRRVYLDTNILIYALEGHPDYATTMAALFERIESGDIKAITSELTLAETLVKPFADHDAERQRIYQTALQSSATFSVVPITRNVLVEAARLRATHALRMPDAIHVATARLFHCDVFLTNDQQIREHGVPEAIILSEVIE